VPIIKKVNLDNDTLHVKADQAADEIHFIGQNGTIMHTVFDTNAATYPIRRNDSYIRTVFRFSDGSSVYLNPIIRHDGDKPMSMRTPAINQSATLYLRIGYFLVVLVLVYFFRSRRQKRMANNK
jgi:hypothetical protein